MAKQPPRPPGGTTGLRESLGRGKSADWASCDPGILQLAIASVSRCGGAIRFGYSRDGGAYSIGIYGDGPAYTVYCAPGDDIDEALAKVASAFEDIAPGSLHNE